MEVRGLATMSLAGISGGSSSSSSKDTQGDQEPIILSVSEALRLLPTNEQGDKNTMLAAVRGMIISMRPVQKMISGRYDKCLQCGKLNYNRLDKPVFKVGDARIANGKALGFVCNEESELHEVRRDKKGEIVNDAEGNMLRDTPFLKVWYEYRNAIIIELQDIEKFDSLERLSVILFDDDTIDVRAGEQVLVKGPIYFEHFSQKDSSLHSRLYSHSIKYEARKEITLSSHDVDAVKRFVTRFGNDTVNQLARMHAPKVIGLYSVKKALLLSANSACDDTKEASRRRLNSLLIGEPGLAKTMLLRETCAIVVNGRAESAQNSSGKSLTAIVSREDDSYVLRLGPIPYAKESVCGLNELGRMSFDDQAPLLDVSEEGYFTVNKYGINARIRSPTVIIGSANPTGSKWSTTDDGMINLNDIPAIKPLIDRFDYVLIVKMSRDKEVSRKYAEDKSKFENTPAPNYNPYLEKHLIYCKRFKPKVSDSAKHILNEFYAGVVSTKGSPRVYDTLYRTVKMIASLKLKKLVDAYDAQEACSFYNEVQMEYNRIIYISPDPLEVASNECIYTLEAEDNPMMIEDIIRKTCDRNENVQAYVGYKYTYSSNRRVQDIYKHMVEDTRVEQISNKPIILRYIKKPEKEKEKEQSSTTFSQSTDTSDIYDICDKSLGDSKTQDTSKSEGDRDTNALSHMSHMSHMSDRSVILSEQSSNLIPVFDIGKVRIVNLMKEKCDIMIAREWLSRSKDYPLAGMSGYLGNPYVIVKPGKESTKPWECRTREEALTKYEEFLYHGKDVVNGRDPKEYRRKALEELPGHYLWGCYCAPEKCHGDILLKWLRRQLQIRRARLKYEGKHSKRGEGKG